MKTQTFETGTHRRIDHRRGVKEKTVQNEITNDHQLHRSKSLQIRLDAFEKASNSQANRSIFLFVLN
jgi:hypothetical protein